MGKASRKKSLAGIALLFCSCTVTHLQCPQNGTQTAIIGGANLASFVAAVAPVAAGLATVLGQKNPNTNPPPLTASESPDNTGWVTSRTLDIFGTTFISCGNQPPPGVNK